jgi:hypothetical protein
MTARELATKAARELDRCGLLTGSEVHPQSASELARVVNVLEPIFAGPPRKGVPGVWMDSDDEQRSERFLHRHRLTVAKVGREWHGHTTACSSADVKAATKYGAQRAIENFHAGYIDSLRVAIELELAELDGGPVLDDSAPSETEAPREVKV